MLTALFQFFFPPASRIGLTLPTARRASGFFPFDFFSFSSQVTFLFLYHFFARPCMLPGSIFWRASAFLSFSLWLRHGLDVFPPITLFSPPFFFRLPRFSVFGGVILDSPDFFFFPGGYLGAFSPPLTFVDPEGSAPVLFRPSWDLRRGSFGPFRFRLGKPPPFSLQSLTSFLGKPLGALGWDLQTRPLSNPPH